MQTVVAQKFVCKVKKVKVSGLHSAYFCSTRKALRHGSHSFTCRLHRAFLCLVSVHQMALPLTGDDVRLTAAYYSFINSKTMKGWVGLVDWPTADGLPTLRPVYSDTTQLNSTRQREQQLTQLVGRDVMASATETSPTFTRRWVREDTGVRLCHDAPRLL